MPTLLVYIHFKIPTTLRYFAGLEKVLSLRISLSLEAGDGRVVGWGYLLTGYLNLTVNSRHLKRITQSTTVGLQRDRF